MSSKTVDAYSSFGSSRWNCGCKYLPEVSAATGFATSIGGTVASFAVGAYLFTPVGFLSAAGYAGYFWYSRQVRLHKSAEEHQGELVQKVMEQASKASLRQKVELESTVIDFDSKPSLSEESSQINEELKGLLLELEGYREDNERLYKKVAASSPLPLSDEDVEKTPMAYSYPQEHTNIAHLRQARNNVGVLQRKGLELFSLLTSFIEKLDKERQFLSKAISVQAEDMRKVVEELQEEASDLKERLNLALAKIQELEEHRNQLMQQFQKH